MQKFSSQDIQQLEKLLGVKKQPGDIENALWKKAEFHAKFFRYIPGIEALCVCNSLAMNACHENSDIDLFIITRPGRIWSARFCITLYCYALGLRKDAQHHKGRFCLSFYCSMEETNFLNIALEDDIYLHYWIESLKPIINKNQAFEQFCKQNKLDILEQKPSSYRAHTRTKLGNAFESLIQKIYKAKTLSRQKALGNPPGIIISDTMLKFHNTDRRREIRDQILKK